MIILDTNVISALMRPASNPKVVDWTNAQSRSSLFTTAVSLMEIRVGLLTMPTGKRRDELTQGFDALLGGLFRDNILPLDAQAAEQASRMEVLQRRLGRNIGNADVQIAGIAFARSATLATRNGKDFTDLDIPLVDPWAA